MSIDNFMIDTVVRLKGSYRNEWFSGAIYGKSIEELYILAQQRYMPDNFSGCILQGKWEGEKDNIIFSGWLEGEDYKMQEILSSSVCCFRLKIINCSVFENKRKYLRYDITLPCQVVDFNEHMSDVNITDISYGGFALKADINIEDNYTLRLPFLSDNYSYIYLPIKIARKCDMGNWYIYGCYVDDNSDYINCVRSYISQVNDENKKLLGLVKKINIYTQTEEKGGF